MFHQYLRLLFWTREAWRISSGVTFICENSTVPFLPSPFPIFFSHYFTQNGTQIFSKIPFPLQTSLKETTWLLFSPTILNKWEKKVSKLFSMYGRKGFLGMLFISYYPLPCCCSVISQSSSFLKCKTSTLRDTFPLSGKHLAHNLPFHLFPGCYAETLWHPFW